MNPFLFEGNMEKTIEGQIDVAWHTDQYTLLWKVFVQWFCWCHLKRASIYEKKGSWLLLHLWVFVCSFSQPASQLWNVYPTFRYSRHYARHALEENDLRQTHILVRTHSLVAGRVGVRVSLPTQRMSSLKAKLKLIPSLPTWRLP